MAYESDLRDVKLLEGLVLCNLHGLSDRLKYLNAAEADEWRFAAAQSIAEVKGIPILGLDVWEHA